MNCRGKQEKQWTAFIVFIFRQKLHSNERFSKNWSISDIGSAPSSSAAPFVPLPFVPLPFCCGFCRYGISVSSSDSSVQTRQSSLVQLLQWVTSCRDAEQRATGQLLPKSQSTRWRRMSLINPQFRSWHASLMHLLACSNCSKCSCKSLLISGS